MFIFISFWKGLFPGNKLLFSWKHQASSCQKNASPSQYPSNNTLCGLFLSHTWTLVFLCLQLLVSFASLLNLKSLPHTRISIHVQTKQNCFTIFIWIFVLNLETPAYLQGGFGWPLTNIINKQQDHLYANNASIKWRFLSIIVCRCIYYGFCFMVYKIPTDNKTGFVFWLCKSLEKLFHSKT